MAGIRMQQRDTRIEGSKWWFLW